MHNNHFNFWFRQPMILRHFNSTGKIQNPQGIVKRTYCFKKTTQRKGWLQSFRFAKLNHPPAIRQDILQFQWLHFLGKKKIKQMSTEKNPFCLSEKPVSNTNLFFSFIFSLMSMLKGCTMTNYNADCLRRHNGRSLKHKQQQKLQRCLGWRLPDVISSHYKSQLYSLLKESNLAKYNNFFFVVRQTPICYMKIVLQPSQLQHLTIY